jgi:hypothetical protein
VCVCVYWAEGMLYVCMYVCMNVRTCVCMYVCILNPQVSDVDGAASIQEFSQYPGETERLWSVLTYLQYRVGGGGVVHDAVGPGAHDHCQRCVSRASCNFVCSVARVCAI